MPPDFPHHSGLTVDERLAPAFRKLESLDDPENAWLVPVPGTVAM